MSESICELSVFTSPTPASGRAPQSRVAGSSHQLIPLLLSGLPPCPSTGHPQGLGSSVTCPQAVMGFRLQARMTWAAALHTGAPASFQRWRLPGGPLTLTERMPRGSPPKHRPPVLGPPFSPGCRCCNHPTSSAALLWRQKEGKTAGLQTPPAH